MSYRIVAYAPNEWHGPWMNRQQLLSRLGRSVPVIYSTGIWSIWDRDDPLWSSAPSLGRFEAADNAFVYHSPRWLVDWPKYDTWSRLSLKLFSRRIRRFSATLGNGPLVGYAFNPYFAGHIRALKPDVVVYHVYDLLPSTPGWTEEMADRQSWFISNADVVIASSRVIADSLRVEGARDVLWLPNGADFDSFAAEADAPGSAPPDIQTIPHPRIGYVGNLNRKVDFPLVLRLAEKHKDWQFIFVGAIGNLDAMTEAAVKRCQILTNVHFLGGKDYRSLPQYVASMDVNTMIYRTDSGVWTEGIYPLKLHEYLAAGKPVVSAAIPSVMEYSNVVAVAKADEHWSELLQAALDEHGTGTLKTRREVAQANSWDIRASVLAAALQQAVENARS